jgi:hypothetical protein
VERERGSCMRTLWIAALVLLLLTVSAPVYAEQADGSEEQRFEITYDLPLQHFLDMNKRVKFNVHIRNLGEPFKGEVAVRANFFDVPTHYGTRMPLNLGQGETKTLSFIIPGHFLQNGAIHIMDSKRIIESRQIAEKGIQGQPVIAVISNRENSYHFLSLLQQQHGANYSVRSLPAEDIPTEAYLLNHLEMIVLDRPEGQELNEEQASALRHWVKRGGVLLASGGTSYAGIQPMFAEFLPIPYTGLTVRKDLDLLRSWSGETILPFTSLDTVTGLEQWIEVYEAGMGRIVVPSFDPASDTLASWKGNAALWTHFFNEHRLNEIIERMRNTSDEPHHLLSESQKIPGVNSPSLTMIVILWSIYIVLAAPLLYWYLKRRDRREWAWLIIPAISVLLTVFVYFFGKQQIAKDNIIYTVSNVNIIDSKFAVAESSASILLVNGGNFSLRMPQGVMPIPEDRNRQTRNSIVWDNRNNGETRLHYEHVPYLTLLQASAVNGEYAAAGAFSANLRFEGERLLGQLTNETSFGYSELTLSLASQKFELGSIEAGETINVDLSLERVIVPTDPKQSDHMKRPYRSKEAMMVTESISRGYDNKPTTYRDFPVLQLIGVSDHPVGLIQTKDVQIQPIHRTYVRQHLTWTPDAQGQWTFPYGTLPVTTLKSEGEVGQVQQGWRIHNGRIVFSLWTEPRGVRTKRVEIPLHEAPFKPFELAVYNFAATEWEKVNQDRPVIIDSSNKNKYVTANGEVRIEIANRTDKKILAPAPYFMAVGEEDTQ